MSCEPCLQDGLEAWPHNYRQASPSRRTGYQVGCSAVCTSSRACVFDGCSDFRSHCSGCPFPSPHLKGAGLRDAPGFATQDHDPARDSNAAQGNAQDMEATSANRDTGPYPSARSECCATQHLNGRTSAALFNLFGKICKGCSEARRSGCTDPRIVPSGASPSRELS